MTLDLLKAQARRLQAYLKAHPDQASALSQGKHASCLEAIAAVHGARNWNTLQASPEVLSEAGVRPYCAPALPRGPSACAVPAAPPELPAVFGGLQPGQVQYCYGKSGSGKSYQTAVDLVQALSLGYSATVLDVGRSYHHLALAFNGVSTIPEQAAVSPKLARALLAAFEFEGWLLTRKLISDEQNPVARRWAQVLPFLQERQGPGHILVVDELSTLLHLLGEHKKLLVDFLVAARQQGSAVHVIGQAEVDFRDFEERLPASRVVTLHGHGASSR